MNKREKQLRDIREELSAVRDIYPHERTRIDKLIASYEAVVPRFATLTDRQAEQVISHFDSALGELYVRGLRR